MRIDIDEDRVTVVGGYGVSLLTPDEAEELRQELNRRKVREVHPSAVARPTLAGGGLHSKVESVVGTIVVPLP